MRKLPFSACICTLCLLFVIFSIPGLAEPEENPASSAPVVSGNRSAEPQVPAESELPAESETESGRPSESEPAASLEPSGSEPAESEAGDEESSRASSAHSGVSSRETSSGHTSREPSDSDEESSGAQSASSGQTAGGTQGGRPASSSGKTSSRKSNTRSKTTGTASRDENESYVEVDDGTLSQPQESEAESSVSSAVAGGMEVDRLGTKIARIIWIPILLAVASAAALVVLNVRYRRQKKGMSGGRSGKQSGKSPNRKKKDPPSNLYVPRD